MEGDLRISVPPADKHGISQCYGPAVTAIRRPKVKMLIVGTNQRRKERHLNWEIVFDGHTAFLFVLMCA